MSPALHARDLAFGYPSRRVGEHVNLEVAAGEVLCLLGPNGCGKTTLFRTLLGLLPALGGTVHVAGLAAARCTRREMARLVAYVPQAHTGTFAYSVEDIVLMGRAARMGAFATPSARDRQVALVALQRLGIEHLQERRYTEISGGERQLTLIARALAQESPLLVLDEPTASLDFGNQVRVLRQIASLRNAGISVCLSTHQPEHALRVGDRFALMKAGRLQAVGTAAQVMTPAALAGLYDVDAADIAHSLYANAAAGGRPPAMNHDEIDFATRYREQMQLKAATPKPASDWDARAATYGRRGAPSNYVQDFIQRMDLSGARTLLDVGCGPGTLALPLAARLEQVVALDYSPGMLRALHDNAAAQRIGNVTTRELAWESNWTDVPVCDIAIASRSTTVSDLGDALVKLNSKARLRVYLTYLAGGRFIDPEILALIGSDAPQIPDQLFVLGILHQMGIQPRLDYIETPSRLAECADFNEFAERVAWTAGAFDAAARERLRQWYEADSVRAQAGGAPTRWAFISWNADAARSSTSRC